ncbi:MAG: hypothetical protein HYS22_05525 [Deltaproteobacteria bacterium]|nr:hypothetical protein [Deltaproteobacteria bacterium]
MKKTILKKVVVVDSSLLAKNMYGTLFSALPACELDYWENAQPLSEKKKQDLLIVNSNTIPQGTVVSFPPSVPVILLVSRDRFDLKEQYGGSLQVSLIEKPFYPYDLLSEVNRLLGDSPKGASPLKRKPYERG